MAAGLDGDAGDGHGSGPELVGVDLGRAVDHFRDLVVTFTPDTTITYCNGAARDLLGHEPSAMVGRSIADFLHADDLTRAVEIVNLMGTDESLVPVTPAIFRIRTAEGGWLGLEVLGQRVTEEGQVVIVGRRSGDRELLEEVLEHLTAGRPPAEVLALLPRFGTWRHPNERYAVVVTDPDGTRRVVGGPLPEGLDGLADGPDGSPFDRARATGEDQRIDRADLPAAQRDLATANGISSVWVRPVPDPLTREAALLVACSSQLGAPSEMHRYPLDLMARALTLVLQWRQHLHSLERLALHDDLTGLANRARFWSELEGASSTATVAVLYVDLDRFKPINDGHGHPVGDAVLVATARRLEASLRPTDLVARLGGDEFAALCPGVGGSAEATQLAARVLDAVGRPLDVDGTTVEVSCSVGVAVGPAIDAEGLLRSADGALYRAKRGGRSQWALAGDGADDGAG